jgi:PilZ domain-containing protein
MAPLNASQIADGMTRRSSVTVANKAADERRSPRSNVVLMAALESGGQCVRTRVANISANGALVAGDSLPREGDVLIFHCNGHFIPSWVAWAKGTHAGIQFDEEIDLAELLRGRDMSRPSPTMMIVKDTRKVDFKRPGFKGNQMTDEERQLVVTWTTGR